MRRVLATLGPVGSAVLSAAIVLIAWQAVVLARLAPEAILPGPSAVLRAGVDEATSGRLFEHLAATLGRLAVGFAVGAAVGTVLGLACGAMTRVRGILMPVVEVLRPIPPLAWVPITLLWFGIGESSKVFLVALTSAFPVLIATVRGVERIDRTILRAARSMDVPRWKLIYAVMLPAALPDVLTGLRLGWTLGITIVVGAEMIAADAGVGHMLIDAMNQGRFERVMLGILILGVLGVASDGLFVRLGQGRLLRWHAGLDQAVR